MYIPVYKKVGDIEGLFDEVNIFQQKAKDAGVDVDYQIYKDLPHNGINPYIGLDDAMAEKTQKICDRFLADNQVWLKKHN